MALFASAQSSGFQEIPGPTPFDLQFFKQLFDQLQASKDVVIPREIRQKIFNYVFPTANPYTLGHTFSTPVKTAIQHKALIPPMNGTCPFMKLPAELRKMIYAIDLNSSSLVNKPRCDDEEALPSSEPQPLTAEYEAMAMLPNGTHQDNVTTRKPNRISDLMRLNKKTCNEVSLVVYEENTFTIHVHGGMKHGGIEFLDAGRQPLQYMSETSDHRFARFQKRHEFGFSRLKKMIIVIYPAAPGDEFRHNPIIMYLTNLAMCRLLMADRQGERIVSIMIQFATPGGKRWHWWDREQEIPKTSSTEDLPDVQMALQPFSKLTGCHKVQIELPAGLEKHKETVQFVRDLEQSMMSNNGFVSNYSDELEFKMEVLRNALEAHIKGESSVYVESYRSCSPGLLTESDFLDDEDGTSSMLSAEDEGNAASMVDDLEESQEKLF